MRLLDAIASILAAADEPLHVEEITRRLITAGLWQSSSKTPQQSVGAVIYADLKHHSATSRFVQTDRRVFTVRPPEPASSEPVAADEPVPAAAEPAAAAAEPATAVAEPGSPEPAAQPVTTVEPELVWQDLFSLIEDGDPAPQPASSSTAPSPAAWPSEDDAAMDAYLTAQYLADAEPAPPQPIEQQLLVWLQLISPDVLVAVVQRLLPQLGLQPGDTPLLYLADGTLQLQATLAAAPLAVDVLVHLTRSPELTPAAPAQLHAARGPYQAALLITTGSCPPAVAAAAAQLPALAVIDGPALSAACLRCGIGVRREQHVQFHLDPAQFAG